MKNGGACQPLGSVSPKRGPSDTVAAATHPSSSAPKADASQPVQNPPKVSQVAHKVNVNTVPNNPIVNSPQAAATSQFIHNAPKPQLANLLIRGSSTPPTPPKNMAEATKPTDQPKTIERPVGAKVVVGPQTIPQGSQTADATRKETSDSGEKKGKEKTDGKKETKGSSGALAAHGAKGATNEELGAAFGGAADDPETQVAQKAGRIFFTEDKSAPVLVRRELLVRDIWQLQNMSEEDFTKFSEWAHAQNSPELERLLTLGRSARKNVYGGLC